MKKPIKKSNKLIMKALITFLLLISIVSKSTSQEVEYYRLKENLKEFTLTPYHNNDMVIWKIQITGSDIKRVVYLDTINGYKVKVPKWLDLKETRSLNFFGGTLPPIGEVENAITISSSPKSNYKDFDDFKSFIIEDLEYLNGISPGWSNGNHKIKSIEKDKMLGFDSYKVHLDFNDSPYLSNYVIVQTAKSYLWINFAATEDTYEKNFKRFKKFIKSLEIL